VAERAQTTDQTLGRIERGEQKDPRMALVWGMARGLGVGVEYLIEMIKDEGEESKLLPTAAAVIGV
jgi:transcriptional regulator with XRE-family HTH domain